MDQDHDPIPTRDIHAETCPRCHRQRLVRLRSMARHSELDWFKCDGCEHLVTRPPGAAAPAAPQPTTEPERDTNFREAAAPS